MWGRLPVQTVKTMTCKDLRWGDGTGRERAEVLLPKGAAEGGGCGVLDSLHRAGCPGTGPGVDGDVRPDMLPLLLSGWGIYSTWIVAEGL